MNKVLICLTGCILFALGSLQAQDNAKSAADSTRPTSQTADTVKQKQDTTGQRTQSPEAPITDTVAMPKDTTTTAPTDPVASAPKDTTAATPKDGSAGNTTQVTPPAVKDNPPASDNPAQAKPAKDSASEERTDPTRRLDNRWFISPLLKGQFQDFAFLEKNRKGYLSDANTLPFMSRGNASFAASAYKNITGRLSVSADIGLSFGHVTNDNVLISQTLSKTYNLLNASIYYHLLPASYRLQPYITIGINDLINDASYLSAPIGVGAKFNAKKVMVMGQITYGYAVSKNISNTTMYSLGIYIPINNKKHKQQEADDQKPWNRPDKDDDKKKDTTAKNGAVVNNIYITINMDSVLKAKGLLDDDGNPIGRKGDGDDDGGSGGGRRRKKQSFMNTDDFTHEDFKEDSIDGKPVVRFMVYFEFNEYSLTSKAFGSIDKVLARLKHYTNLTIEIKGYTDSVGTNAFNNFLSRRRANMVKDYLNSRGVPAELMKAKAYGSDNPVADNSDPNQAWLNRRAEIIVHPKEQ
ncbi:MAG TPA: OmpA family protein [Puia sp.]|nr:OmpA family protein [Puia sp.]